MRWHRVEPAGAQNVWRPDGIIRRTKIDCVLTRAARPADHMQTLATHTRRETLVTARLLVAVAAGRLIATNAVAHNIGARVVWLCSTKWADAARA